MGGYCGFAIENLEVELQRFAGGEASNETTFLAVSVVLTMLQQVPRN